MTLRDQVRSLGGVALTATLRDRGVSKLQLARACDSGEIRRIKRGWVALPDADGALVLAASTGTVLTCVSQARKLGLWVLRHDCMHLAVTRQNGHVKGSPGKLHWAQPWVPRNPESLTDPIENVLGFVAKCQPYEVAVAIWESALNKGMVDVPMLSRLPYRGAARRLVEECTPYADSGLESFVRIRLRWLQVSVVAQAWVLGHRVDFLIDGWLVLQIDGGHHTGAQRSADIRHDADLQLRGYRVIRCSYEQVVHRWEEVQELIQGMLARRGVRRRR